MKFQYDHGGPLLLSEVQKPFMSTQLSSLRMSTDIGGRVGTFALLYKVSDT